MCPAVAANDYLCRACFVYSALQVGAATMLCLHLALTGVLADRRADVALVHLGAAAKRSLRDLAPGLPL